MCATTWPTSSAPAWKVCAASARWTGAWWTASPSPRNLPPPSMKPPHAWPKAAPAPPRRTATLTLKAPTGAQPTDIAGIEAAGAAWWPLALARQLDDAILNLRTNELDIGTWLLKTEGDAQAVLASDAALIAHQDHWLVRETIGALRRTFARLDVSSRSLFALVESGSAFAGSLAELAFAADRTYMLALPDDAERAPKITLNEFNFGLLPMVNDQSRLQRRFYEEAALQA